MEDLCLESNYNSKLIVYENGDAFKIKSMHVSLGSAYKYTGSIEDAKRLRDWLTGWIEQEENNI
jgi:hypothetical protein